MFNAFLFTRGMAAGLLVILCLKLWLQHRHHAAGRLLLAVFAGLGAYVVLPFLQGWPVLFQTLLLPAIAVPLLFWWFTLALFDDTEPQPMRIGRERWQLALVFIVLSYTSYGLNHSTSFSGGFLATLAFGLSYVLRIGFVALALHAVTKEWKNDLVSARRRLRTLLLTVSSAYILLVLCVELWLGGSAAPLLLEQLHSLVLVILLLALVGWLVLMQPDGLSHVLPPEPQPKPLIQTQTAGSGEQQPAEQRSTLSVTEQRQLNALQHFMEQDEGYQIQQLTITKLADALTIPEHQLRRLINQQLGYRNFNDYLNHFRTAEAARRLADPEQEQLPILTIALDVGYGSLTPFNRAFKARYQQTPSTYRQTQLAAHQ